MRTSHSNFELTISMRRRRCSSHVRLVLIGVTAAMAGCDDGPIVRDLYANRQDCVADWGADAHCESIANSNDPHSVHWGPTYSSESHASGSRALGQHQVSRGGFGSSARLFSGGS
jgi:uncharacterized protein YgiB involved in biofilm formation